MSSREEILREGPVTLQIYHNDDAPAFILLVHAEYREIGKDKIAARFDELARILSKLKKKIAEVPTNEQ